MNPIIRIPLAAVFVASSIAGMAHGQAILGTDNASALAYSGGWTNNSDGFITGEGAYGQWFQAGTGATSFTIADVSSLGGSTALNTNGVAFRLFGNTGNQSDAYRFIDPNGLGAGQTFSIQMAVNYRNGYKGIDLRGATTGDPTIFTFNVGSDDYAVSNAATGNGSLGNAYSSDSVFTLSFTQTDLAGGTWTIDRSGGFTDSDSGTYLGIARSFKLYVGGTIDGPENALFVNNLTTVPEPSTTALLSAFALGAGAWFLRRRAAR